MTRHLFVVTLVLFALVGAMASIAAAQDEAAAKESTAVSADTKAAPKAESAGKEDAHNSESSMDKAFEKVLEEAQQPVAEEADVMDTQPRLLLKKKLSDDFMTKKVNETREIGKRTFELSSGIWSQKGYAEEKAEFLPRKSDKCAAFIKADPTVQQILELGDYVMFEVDGNWYKILPNK